MVREKGFKSVDVRSVDIGHFNVKGTHGRRNGNNGDSEIITFMFPALAPVLSGPKLAFAQDQRSTKGVVVEVNGLYHYVGEDVETTVTALEPRDFSEDYCTTGKYQALLYGSLNAMAKEEALEADGTLLIEHLVVGLPLNTYSRMKPKLLNITKGEHHLRGPDGTGRSIIVREVTVLTQPQGALYEYGHRSGGTLSGWTLVVDAGGGTLDYLVGRPSGINYGRSGAYPKSMLACAQAVVGSINPAWVDNLGVIHKVDEAIRNGSEHFTLLGNVYEMANYKRDVDAVLTEAVAKMLAEVGALADLDRILCTGGGGKVFYEFLAAKHPEFAKLLVLDSAPVYANVRGFQIRGEIAHAFGAR